MGNSKLFVGLGLGALIGGVVTYLASTSKGKKMRRDICNSIHEIEEDAADMLYTAKDKVENAGNSLVNKVSNKYNYAKGRVDEKISEMVEKPQPKE